MSQSKTPIQPSLEQPSIQLAAHTDSESVNAADTKQACMADRVKSEAQAVSSAAIEKSQDVAEHVASHYVKEPARDLLSIAKKYAKEHPDVAACWAFGLGVLVGCKLKP